MALEIINYTEKSIAVFGDTKSIKDKLQALGGRFNPRLNYDGTKRAGWIFPKKIREEVEGLCNSEDEKLNSSEIKHTSEIKTEKSLEEMDRSFHRTLKILINMEGLNYLTNPGLINALSDYNAYTQYPALKGILKIILQDGFMDKINHCSSWNMTAKKITMSLIQSYAIDINLATYAMQSIAFAKDIIKEDKILIPGVLSNQNTPESSDSNSNKQQSSVQNARKWKQMTFEEKEDYLNSLIEIQQSNYGIHIDSIYIPYEENNESNCYVNYQITIKSKLVDACMFCGDIYDKSGKLRSHEEFHYFSSSDKKGEIRRGSVNYWKFRVKKDDISRIVFYFQHW